MNDMPVCIKGRIYILADIHEAEVRSLKREMLDMLESLSWICPYNIQAQFGPRIQQLEAELKEQADD